MLSIVIMYTVVDRVLKQLVGIYERATDEDHTGIRHYNNNNIIISNIFIT